MCLGRHTVTGLLSTCGHQFTDWTAAYRLFSQARVPLGCLFSAVRRSVLAHLSEAEPFSVVLDDTLLRRSGNKTPGVAWRRDPLGPRFQTNFVRAQRFLQFSAALPLSGPNDTGLTRMVPVGFFHCPTPPKPSPKATAEDRAEYRKKSRETCLSHQAVKNIESLRTNLDGDEDGCKRLLIVAFDGGYTNATVLKQIPQRTVCIGRIRKDAALCLPPDDEMRNARGRCLRYGKAAPTPEQFRTDDSYPWETVAVSHSGATHQVRYKRIAPLMWRTAGAMHLLQLVIIAPLGYRLRKGSRILYRQPGFLICTDPDLEVRRIVETYFQRWDIEVNFRDEKTLLGVGQAQVRNDKSVEAEPALAVASYAMLLIAAQRAFGNCRDKMLPPPKWSATRPLPRVTTQQLLHQLRTEVWSRGLGIRNFSDFTAQKSTHSKPEKFNFPLASAVCYANA